ncbi:site-specific integrase, partial [Rhizobium sp. XQZ8]|uniref:site-specific integrase n=1 Tax=Rhizobium populisoli TaxID=2859785 RepID=UPI001CA5718C
MGQDAEKPEKAKGLPTFGHSYALNYQFQTLGPIKIVKPQRLVTLLERYVDILWEAGSHKNNVNAFIRELDEILLGQSFETFTDEMVDRLTGELRKRGNSNATINRKMAALSKLLRKAFKMG